MLYKSKYRCPGECGPSMGITEVRVLEEGNVEGKVEVLVCMSCGSMYRYDDPEIDPASTT